MLPKRIFVAGSSAVFGHEEIRSSFRSIGIETEFIESDFMKPYMAPENCGNITWTSNPHLKENEIVLPLTEYWISWCIKNRGKCRISSLALECSRSKRKFSRVLKEAGFDAPMEFGGREEASEFVRSQKGRRIIIKPEGLLSGYGVEIVSEENLHKIEEYERQIGELHPRTLKLMGLDNRNILFTELVEGTEYSADCFLCDGRFEVVRLCRKEVVAMSDKPCTVAIQLVPVHGKKDGLTQKIADCLKSWCGVLFGESDISFAQFDFIAGGGGRIVPIDFASRIGGGMEELMKDAMNPYAKAVLGEFGQEKSLVQYNFLPARKGVLQSDDFSFPEGRAVVYKHKGDYVISNPSSTGSRIAVLITDDEEIKKGTVERCLVADGIS